MFKLIQNIVQKIKFRILKDNPEFLKFALTSNYTALIKYCLSQDQEVLNKTNPLYLLSTTYETDRMLVEYGMLPLKKSYTSNPNHHLYIMKPYLVNLLVEHGVKLSTILGYSNDIQTPVFTPPQGSQTYAYKVPAPDPLEAQTSQLVNQLFGAAHKQYINNPQAFENMFGSDFKINQYDVLEDNQYDKKIEKGSENKNVYGISFQIDYFPLFKVLFKNHFFTEPYVLNNHKNVLYQNGQPTAAGFPGSSLFLGAPDSFFQKIIAYAEKYYISQNPDLETPQANNKKMAVKTL